MQHQLLHAPVEELGDVEHVLRGAGDLVDPAELLQLLPGFAEHPENLPVEAQLVHASRERVGDVEHLFRAGRDAHRPRRARHHRLRISRGLDLRHIGQVADRRARLRIVRHVYRELALEPALPVEHLDAPVAAVGDVDVPLRVRRDRVRRVEFAGFGAAVAPRLDPLAVPVHLGDARVDMAVADKALPAGSKATSVTCLKRPSSAGSGGLGCSTGPVSSSEASCLRPNTSRTLPPGLNFTTMSDPLSATQMLSPWSTRTVWPNDQAYRFLPISRTNFPSPSNSSSCAAAAAYAGPVVLPRERTKMLPFEFTATPVTSPRYRSFGNFSGSDASNGICGTASCANAGDASSTSNPTTRHFMTSSFCVGFSKRCAGDCGRRV